MTMIIERLRREENIAVGYARTLFKEAADELEAKDKRIKELEAWRDQAVRFQEQINMLERYILKLEAELKAVNPAALILKTSL